MFRFENLLIYQRSVEFSSLIYSITKTWRSKGYYSLSDQLERAGLSIALNIAEGSSRTKKDFSHFLSISRGSCFECIPILYIANKLKLIPTKEMQNLYNESYELSKMISSFRSSQK